MRFNRMTTALLSVFILLSAEIPVRAQNPPPVFNPPKGYYLALGDSIAYGFQSFKFAANLPPEAYNTGYVDVFGAQLRQIRPGITTVNYGCPGESTGSFVVGPCVWTATGHQLHDVFTGTQLQAALTFLRAHPGEVSPITLTIGSICIRHRIQGLEISPAYGPVAFLHGGVPGAAECAS